MTEIKGIIPPILTPMDEEENVNEKELRNQVNRLIGAGVHGIFAFGTNGEGYALSESEKESILEVVIEETAGRVPVYAGSGCITTKDTIRMSQKAKSLGADVLSVITPWFAAASQNDLLEHYKEVAKAVDIPIVLYNIPARCGNALLPATVAKLAEIDNIVGAKDSSGSFDNMLQYIELTREKDFAILSGNDSLIYWNLLAGGAGGIAGCANVFPKNMAGIYDAFISGDLKQAKTLQDNIRPFRNCFRFGNPNTIVKAAVALLGYPVGRCRRPFDQISQEGQAALSQVLEEYRQKGIG
ncbi:MAG: 4-hydroxy-tetrahydrodipicolinate synthase [Lachnospiraceae bacterium]|nr:4-hydroxy-tetrahydrodipicolinate synthase [Lachnospiraceae bacterium]